MPPAILVPVITGLPFSGTSYNNNLSTIESSFADIGPFLHGGGLIPTVGTGLSVNVSSGTAVIGAHLDQASFVIGGLTPSTTVHLYLNQNGTGTSNTTGIQPANSVKLGTAITGVSTVTSVNINRDSGRQTFVRPENQVHGGPGAGNPASVNLASWAPILANAAEVFGVLPAAAVPAPAAPLTLTVTDTGTTNEPAVLTLSHRTSATPGASFGSVFTMVADNAANSPVGQLFVNAGWSAATAGAESSLAEFFIRVAGVDTEVMRLNANGNGQLRAVKDFQHAGAALGFYNTTPVAQPINTRDLRLGLIDLGLRAAGGATPLDLNGGTLTAATITGDCLGAVSLTPGSDTRNRIQATGDFIPLSVEQFAGQAHDLFVAYASDGTTKLTRLTSAGVISSPGAGSGSERFGLGSLASGTSSTAVGPDAHATNGPGVAVGNFALASGDTSAALGPFCQATAADAVAVGNSCQATNTFAVALGFQALATDATTIAIGKQAHATGGSGIALGETAVCAATDGLAIGLGATVTGGHVGSICIGRGAASTAAGQCVLGGPTDALTDIYFGGGASIASPYAAALHGGGASGANIAGASLTLAGGQGTGSAVGGDLVVQSTYAGGAGSSLNTLHELARVSQLGVLSLTQLTSIQDRTAFNLTPSWATSTDASRKARAVFNIWDTAAREGLRLEASGSAPMIGFLGATAVVRPAATDDLRQSLINLGLYTTGGATPLNLNGGALTTGSIANAGTYAGSAAPPQIKRAAITFPSDADYTMLSTEYDAFWLDIQVGVITATRNVIVPVQAGMIYVVRNNNTHDVVIKTASGTGITVAAGRARIVMSGAGTNMSSLTSSNDFSL